MREKEEREKRTDSGASNGLPDGCATARLLRGTSTGLELHSALVEGTVSMVVRSVDAEGEGCGHSQDTGLHVAVGMVVCLRFFIKRTSSVRAI